MKTSTILLMMLLLLPLLPACNDPGAPPSAGTSPTPPAPHDLDDRLVARGGDIYKANCAVCHGANAEGAPNWQRKGPDGKLPPPPLDANGHAWHHPSAWLREMIKQGTIHRGGNMPSWEGKLSEDDINSVIAWIQSRWPEEIYRSWLAMEQKAAAGQHKH
jgi:mono/diheme cytochrome c family protein